MKNRSILFLLLSAFLIIVSSCEKDKSPDESGVLICGPAPNNCFKGRLVIDDICGNYTIKVLKGKIDSSLILSTWKHPQTNVTYNNVFSLGNSCSFPDSIKKGDEFYFQIKDTKPDPACTNCLAYVPTPGKRLSIIVYNTPCDDTIN